MAWRAPERPNARATARHFPDAHWPPSVVPLCPHEDDIATTRSVPPNAGDATETGDFCCAPIRFCMRSNDAYFTHSNNYSEYENAPSSPAGQCPLVDLNAAAASARPSLSVVVPTRNEELNAGPLIGRLTAALACPETELIVVDDSDDDTPQAFADSAARSPLPVRLLHRRPGARKGGLSSAVIAGARWARGQWVLVMDADLQHPPEAAAMLASTAVRHDSDIVVGTRYAGTGSPADGLGRQGPHAGLLLGRPGWPRPCSPAGSR